MVEMAVNRGFVPVLGVLWCCYAWNRGDPNPNRMTPARVREYATFAAELFKRFQPIFFISGDTPQNDEAELDLYRVALEAVRSVCPRALCSMHLWGGQLPHERLRDDIDFYMYQSSHGGRSQQLARQLAKQYLDLPPKPVVNAEPCYEGHGRMGVEDRNKFSAFDVRRATWQSLLSGAVMGIAYGAQGLWSGQVEGMKLIHEKSKFEAYDWEFAYQLEGSWDAAFARWIFESYNLFDIEPTQIVLNDDEEIVSAADADLSRLVAYAPYTTSVEFAVDLSGYTCAVINLHDRRIWRPPVRCGRGRRWRRLCLRLVKQPGSGLCSRQPVHNHLAGRRPRTVPLGQDDRRGQSRRRQTPPRGAQP